MVDDYHVVKATAKTTAVLSGLVASFAFVTFSALL